MGFTSNRKNACFLCLKTPHSPGDTFELKEIEMCLNNICCGFLNISTAPVNLCSSCYFVTEKLSHLLEDLEVIRLQVSYYSEVVHRILEEANVTPSETSKDLDLTEEAKTAGEHFRKKFKRKCAVLKNAPLKVAVVKLRRLKAEGLPRKIKPSIVAPSLLKSADIKVECSPPLFLNCSKFENARSTLAASDPIPAEHEIPKTARANDDDPRAVSVSSSIQIHRCGNAVVIKRLQPFDTKGTTLIGSDCTDKLLTSTQSPGVKRSRLEPAEVGPTTEKHPTPVDVIKSADNGQNCDTLTSSRSKFETECVTSRASERISEENEFPSTSSPVKEEITEMLMTPFSALGGADDAEAIKRVELSSDSSIDSTDAMKDKLEELVRSHCPQPESPTQTPYNCNFCGEKIKLQLASVRCHLASVHSEQIFSFSNFLQETLDEGCHPMVAAEDKKCEKFRATTPQGKESLSSYACRLCRKKCVDHRYLKQHIVIHFADALWQKMCGLQNVEVKSVTPSPGSLAQRSILNNARPSLLCLHCRHKCSRPFWFRIHMITTHPEQLFLGSKDPQRSLSDFKTSCRKVIEMATVGFKKRGTVRTCRHCKSSRKWNPHTYLDHLHVSHREILAEEIKALEDRQDIGGGVKRRPTPSRQTKLWGKKEANSGSGGRSRPKIPTVGERRDTKPVPCPSVLPSGSNPTSPKKNGAQRISWGVKSVPSPAAPVAPASKVLCTVPPDLVCLHCRHECASPYWYRIHLTTNHPEQVFLSSKAVHRPLSEFQISCRKVLERATSGFKSRDVRRTCSFCKSSRSWYPDTYLNHLLVSHREILAEKIKELEDYQDKPAGAKRRSTPAPGKRSRSKEEVPPASGGSKKRKGVEKQRGAKQIPCPPLSPREFSPTGEKMKEILDEMVKKHCPPLESCTHFKCNLCGERINLNQHAIRRHLTTKHAATLLSFAKHADVPAEVFTRTCLRVLEKEVLKGARRSTPAKRKSGNRGGGKLSSSSSSSLRYVCSLCSKTSLDSRDQRHHLIIYHADTLCPKLWNLQSQEKWRVAPAKCSKECSPASPAGKTWPSLPSDLTCPVCHKKLCQVVTFRRHLIVAHPDQVFLSIKPPHQPLLEFREACRQIMEMETKGLKYVKYKKATSRRCPYCTSSRQWEKHSYSGHLVDCHKEMLTEKIKEALENSKEGSSYQRPSEDKDNGPIGCTHCTANFPRSTSLRLHMLCRHPEQLFLPLKPDHQSLSEFATCCRQVLEQEAGEYSSSPQGQTGTTRRQCAYCSTDSRWQHQSSYLCHLVASHKHVLEGKIKAHKILKEEDGDSYPVIQGVDWVDWGRDRAREDFEEEEERRMMENPFWAQMDAGIGVEREEGNERDTKPFPRPGDPLSSEDSANIPVVRLESCSGTGAAFQTSPQGYPREGMTSTSTSVPILKEEP